MARKKAKTYNIKSKIVNKIRSVWRYSPLRKEVKERCEIDDHYYVELPRKIKGLVKVIKVKFPYYRCEKCRKITEKIEVDHKIPAIDIEKGWQGFDSFIERLFCDISNLQGICKRCHDKKTNKENKVRKIKKPLDKKIKE